MDVVLETPRLRLREMQPDDLDFEGTRRPEVGWLLHRPFWGKGYATEAGMAVRDAAFQRWRYPALISLIRPVNEPSRRVAERVGFTPGPRVQFHGFEHVMYETAAPTPAPRGG